MECYQFASTFSGKPKDFFCLEKYKVEVGKDYKRIIFYLCSEADFRNYEKILEGKDSDVEVDSGPEDLHEQHFTDQFFAQQFMADDGNDGSDSIFTVPFSFTSATSSTSTFTSNLISTTSSTATSSSTSAQAASIRDYKDIVKILGSKVNHADEFYLVIRRGTQFIRLLRLWRRQSLKSKPTNIVRVHYSGEDGIDSGAIALEFFEHCMTEMGKVMFPNGSPINSSLYVQNGDLRTCGEIAAASLAQGGPAPSFLASCTYESAFQDIDMMSISSEHLTEKEKELIRAVRSNCKEYIDLILEHNYTGVIDEKNIEEIVGSLKVSFVTNRRNQMKEFMIGLQSYDLDNLIKNHPEACRSLFVNGNLEYLIPDSDYLFSIMTPLYATESASKRLVEEKVMDHLQDTLNAFEDENLTGTKAALAWNEQKGVDIDNEDDADVEEREKFESPSISIPKVMGWLTGLQHKPLSGEKLQITIHFDHDCLERNPKHTVCFPLISACAKTVTLPVAHLKTLQDFKELFITAFCKGQSFARP